MFGRCCSPGAGLISLVLVSLTSLPAAAQWPADPLVNVPICTAANNQRTPHIVPDQAGGAIIAWVDLRSGPFDFYTAVHAQRVLASGAPDPTWPAQGLAVSATASAQATILMVEDGAGGVILMWPDVRTGTEDIYAQHVLANGTIDPAWPATGSALCTNVYYQWGTQSVADGSGGAFVTWADYRNGDHTQPDIYAHHVLADGTADAAWAPDGVALCTAPNRQYNSTLVTDGGGGIVVMWRDRRDGFTYDLYAEHVLASGAVDPAWTADGSLVAVSVSDVGGPQMVPDGAGGAFVTWDGKAQHVLATGVVDPAWPAAGCALGSGAQAPAQNMDPAIVADGAGGVIVAWADARTIPDYDIYAQRVQADGVIDPAWPAEGRGVCTQTNYQFHPSMVADGAGGAIVSWRDLRNDGGSFTNMDLYAMRVQANGELDPAWPADGRALSTATGNQDHPQIAADRTGGGIVVWEDGRNGAGNLDVYAQRVQSDGELGGVTPVLPSLVSVAADERGVRLEWFAPRTGAVDARVYRRAEDSGWRAIATLRPDAAGLIAWLDRAVEPGQRYGYRIGLADPSGERFFGETWITVPEAARFSLDAVQPNPADRDLTVSFSLPTSEPASVEWIDLSGRVVARRALDPRPGSHVVTFHDGRTVAPGIYLVRLTHGGRSISRKVCVVH